MTFLRTLTDKQLSDLRSLVGKEQLRRKKIAASNAAWTNDQGLEATLQASIDLCTRDQQNVVVRTSGGGYQTVNHPAQKLAIAAFAKEQQDRIDIVTKYATEILGCPNKAEKWMYRANALTGVTPASLLITDEGLKDVLQMLNRIEHGIYG